MCTWHRSQQLLIDYHETVHQAQAQAQAETEDEMLQRTKGWRKVFQ